MTVNKTRIKADLIRNNSIYSMGQRVRGGGRINVFIGSIYSKGQRVGRENVFIGLHSVKLRRKNVFLINFKSFKIQNYILPGNW